MAKTKPTKKNSKISLSDADLNSAIESIKYIDSVNAENHKNAVTKSLLGGTIPEQPIGLSYVNPAPAPIPTPNPLPSVQGGNAVPTGTLPQSAQPSQYSSNASAYHDTKDMNRAERELAMAQQVEEDNKANLYNSAVRGVMGRVADQAPDQRRQPMYDMYGYATTPEYTPMAPLPTIPRKIDIPNMVTGSFGESFKESSGNRNPSPREKYKTPTIVNPDYTKGVVNPLSPSSVFLDIQGGIRAANDAGNPSLGRKATDDNFGTQIIPKGTMAKMPVWMFNKQTGKYDFKGINDVDVGGASMADVAQRVATSWIAHNLMNDINAGKSFNVKVKDKNGNIVNKQIPLVSNYGQEVGASQLKFAPSVFVQALGGDYNTAIADAYTKTVDSLGLPSGSVTYRPNSVVARRIEDKNSKAHQTWLGAKDNDLTGDTINGWGNSIINGLFGQMFGAK